MSAKVERWDFGTDMGEELLDAISAMAAHPAIRQINAESYSAERGYAHLIIRIPLRELEG